jgi:valyl-tRNA synthetase
MNTENHHDHNPLPIEKRHVIDRWIITTLQATIQKTHDFIKQYRFDLMAHTLYDFTWNEYCDWYLEFSKAILNEEGDPAIQQATRHTLITVLESVLRLLHPIIPFITEEIWQKIGSLAGKQGDSIMIQPYPRVDEKPADPQADNAINWLKQVIVGIRTIRAEMNIAPGKPLTVLLHEGDTVDRHYLQENERLLMHVAKLASIQWLEETPPAAASALVGNMKVLIPLAGLINVTAETARLQKELAKLETDYQKIMDSLSNKSFLSNAPEAIVAKQQQRQQELQANIAAIQQQIQNFILN